MYKNEKDNNIQITLPLVSKNEDNVVFPLVINVLTKFWGEITPDDEISHRSTQYANHKGTIFIEGLEIIEKKFKLLSKIYRGSLDDLKKRLGQGIPLIVILPGINETIQFATIVTGYDPEEKRLITYVPEPDSFGAIPEEKFFSEWSQEDYLTIMIFPEDAQDLLKKSSYMFEKTNRVSLEAERLKIQGKTKEALELLTKTLAIIDDEKDNPQLLLMIAGILNEQDDEKCVQLYEKIIELNPKFYLAHRGLGNYYLKRKNYLQSKQHYLNAIDISPSRYGPIYKNLGITFLNLGNDASAKESFREYLQRVPNAPDRINILDFINS
ncbi:tetratricopeptide repeat protein [Candidatus Nitrosocosmicus arcticus]|uniref:TPR repeat protein n=1 Tax=Candidatus Nitrosocosmicus arcticus TaxID=2035267 RepID=A0A557SW43_9ARCH|nr:tetratricopeptide repeat protein [Candidatus Nitrosocosmicus arcticus]TVP40813.1 TPR repeat protein [Candidatus Nitrosocosmicus arcticus]